MPVTVQWTRNRKNPQARERDVDLEFACWLVPNSIAASMRCADSNQLGIESERSEDRRQWDNSWARGWHKNNQIKFFCESTCVSRRVRDKSELFWLGGEKNSIPDEKNKCLALCRCLHLKKKLEIKISFLFAIFFLLQKLVIISSVRVYSVSKRFDTRHVNWYGGVFEAERGGSLSGGRVDVVSLDDHSIWRSDSARFTIKLSA